MNNRRVIGIDYSMSCPAITILENDYSFDNSRIQFLTNVKKYQKKCGNISGLSHREYSNNIERFHNISSWAVDFINAYCSCITDSIYIEDYSLGSKGKTFDIAENTGILKYKLFLEGFNVNVVSPGAIKKFATGKGNAKKEDMYFHFTQHYPVDNPLLKVDNVSSKIASPISDIVDSFWIAKYGQNQLKD